MTKGRLNEVLVKVEEKALQQVEDYIDQFLPDDKEFVECVIRDIMIGVCQGLTPEMAEDDEPNKVLDGQGSQDANARLIAAAPDMLKALKEIADSPNGRGFAQWAKFIVAIPAIEKATGLALKSKGV